MINYNKALEIIRNEIINLPLCTEEVDILESFNRIIAEDIIADVDLPPFDNSAVDGYAIIFSNKKEWNIIGEISAGNYSSIILNDNDAVLVTTGSKLPLYADTVIPLEDTVISGVNMSLKSDTVLTKGLNIRKQGSDLQKGKIAIKNFTRIDPKTIAVLASCGKEKVKVFKKLNIALFATGDELIPINEKPFEDKLRASNVYSINAAIREINQIPVYMGFVKDDKKLIRQKVKAAFESDINILITTGGVSVGKYDFLKDIFNEEGVKEKFWKVNVKPGKPMYFGVYENFAKKILVFGLPGNPVSSLVNFYVFVKPAIEFLFKQKSLEPITAVLQNEIKKKDGKRHFALGILFKDNNEWKVTSKFSQSSGNLVEMSRANCLIVLNEDLRNPQKGERVECIMI